MIFGLALSPSLDVTYLVDDLQLGQISVPTRVVQSAGGKTLNAVRVAAQLGSAVSVVAVLGGHTGSRVASLLEPSGIRLTLIDAGAETRTCVSVFSASVPGLTELYAPAAPLTDAAWRDCLASFTDLGLAEGDWLLLAGSVPAGVPLAELAAALREYRDRGVRVAVDTHGLALAAIIAAKAVDLVKVNRSEAAALLGKGLSLDELTMRLKTAAGAIAVVTDGIDGSAAADAGNSFRVEPDAATGSFPVGSGDSYFGGLVHGLDEGMPPADALRLAASCASANAVEPGAGVLDLATVELIRARIKVT